MVDKAEDVSREGARREDSRRLSSRVSGKQRRRQRLAIGIIGTLLLVVVGIVVAGYAIIFVLPPRVQVVRVDDVSYTRGDMVKLLRVRQAIVRAQGGQFDSSEDVFMALQIVVENEIVAQVAPRFGISVTRQELDDAIRSIMAPTVFDSQGKADDQVEREFRERYGSYLNSIQASESEHRDLVRKSILRDKVRQLVGDQVPLIAEQVRVHRIAMSPKEDEVDIMQTKLEDAIGEDKSPENIRAAFKSITKEFSRDPQSAQNRGDLGWVPLGIYDEYDYAFFDLEVGELSTAVPNRDDPSQTYFFMVSERSVTRALDPANVDILKTRALQDWLNEERANHDIFAAIDSSIYAWMTEQLRITSPVTPVGQ